MNTYILPLCDEDGPYIYKVIARSYREAESSIVKKFADEFDFIDYADSYEELADKLEDHDIQIGEIYDIDTI